MTTAPPSTPKTSTATPSLYSQALAQAKAALAAQITPLNDQIGANDASAQLGEQNAANAAKAAGDILAGIAPDVQHTYETAANDQSAFAKGFSQAMQDAVSGQDNSLNALLDKLHNPGSRLDPGQAAKAADVLYGIGGYIPATTFSNEGAAQVAAAQKLPGIALLQGQQTSRSIAQSAQAQDATLRNKIAELAGKLPGDVQTNYEKLQQLALNDAKFKAQLAHNKVTETQAQERINQSALNYKLSAAKFARQQFQQDREYQLSLARLGLSQKRLQLQIAANAYKAAHGGLTASQVARYNTKLDSLLAAGKPTHAITADVRGVSAQVMPNAVYYDKNGKVVRPSGPNGTFTPADQAKIKSSANTNTYVHFVKAGLKAGVPIQLVLQKANATWPPNERADLGALEQIPAIAEQMKAQAAGYNQMVGVGAGRTAQIGTSPQGTPIYAGIPNGLSRTASKAAASIVNLAAEYLGTPYAWGGDSPTGFDCSGLAQYVYGKEGISIPRTTFEQYKSGIAVPKGKLQPGDLVFFAGSDGSMSNPGHVGIYVGSGRMIVAPHTGASVTVESVNQPDYVGARRYVR